jgi:hypothetical protein
MFDTLEAAQRAADEKVLADHPHDCRFSDCSRWSLRI